MSESYSVSIMSEPPNYRSLGVQGVYDTVAQLLNKDIAKILKQNEVDGKTLVALNKEDIEDLFGSAPFQQRKKVRDFIQTINSEV